MKYQCQVLINSSLEKVISSFLEKMVLNKDLTPGNKCTFTHEINENYKMKMTETIESVNLPDEIVTIFEVDQVWNRCVNQFVPQYNRVLYTMLVEFRFKNETEIKEENFRKKTQSQMDEFRRFVENEGND